MDREKTFANSALEGKALASWQVQCRYFCLFDRTSPHQQVITLRQVSIVLCERRLVLVGCPNHVTYLVDLPEVLEVDDVLAIVVWTIEGESPAPRQFLARGLRCLDTHL